MGSTTTRTGLPYPVGTDRVMDGDNAMQALAERLDGSAGAVASVPYAVAVGVTTVNIANTNQGQVAVTFPVGRFSIGPMVFQSILGVGLSSVTAIRMTASPGPTGFTSVVNTSATVTGNVSLSWMAIQMTTSSAPG